MEEYLDIVDENGNPTGETVARSVAHREGIRHRTSHLWICRKKNGRTEILLQKRSHEKDSFPDCYDISSAGHIPAGSSFVPSALRELKEELGVTASPEDLVFCGKRSFEFQKMFHGKPFHDRQVSAVFLLWLDREEADFTLQKEEISSVRWMDFEECIEDVRDHKIPNCIDLEELELIRKQLNAAIR